MARPSKQIETPGASAVDENTSDAQLLNSIPANTPEQLNAATAGATVTATDGVTEEDALPEPPATDMLTVITQDIDIAARNKALSELNAEAFQIITKFESYAFVDEHDNPLTNCVEFIDLVKRATTPITESITAATEDGQRGTFSAPVLTDHGWLIK